MDYIYRLKALFKLYRLVVLIDVTKIKIVDWTKIFFSKRNRLNAAMSMMGWFTEDLNKRPP